MTEQRTRTVTWNDPAIYATRPDLNGLEWLQAVVSGELPTPPFGELLEIRIAEAERGRVVFTMPVLECHYSPLNIVHGGITATLLDTVMGCAVQSMLERGGGYSTMDLQVRFVRPVSVANGTLRAEGRAVHAGKRTATAEGEVKDESGKIVAHGTCGCLLL